jgi:NAD(P)-dependent dehydrogenase (short-subunit alcohol dehydrogenase family)
MKWQTKTWLITGGSSGVGRKLCERLIVRGYNVAATSRNVQKLSDLPESVLKIALDIRDKELCKECIAKVIRKFGSLDVLINNAGVTAISSFEEMSNKQAENVWQTNFVGTCNMIKSALPIMRANKNGSIVNITSIRGIQPRSYGADYSASKFALEGLGRALKHECQRFLRIMNVELGAFPESGITERAINNPPQIPEYQNLPDYTKIKYNFKNDLADAVDVIISSVCDGGDLPRNLPLGKDSVIIIKDEIKKLKSELSNSKKLALSVARKVNNRWRWLLCGIRGTSALFYLFFIQFS